MKLPDYFFICDFGDLYDTRKPNWHKFPPLRYKYKFTHKTITNMRELKATLRAGQFIWPGGYTMYFVTADHHAVSFEGVLQAFADIRRAIIHQDPERIVGTAINFEEQHLYCDVTGQQIPPSYE